ncbi:hypothetical protein EMIHUDRAFT_111090 [Emiliania huxleyi CCMP1516]|uniref:EamA domain-containing protein n=2 Tax=Emiliania huxleyi TaxID=2903 RepID=A0A0D3KGK2_EMIH1|nr:hypothetical protein EMIHUDRAFT_111090 [Emiliania huxleyi CCMP1516]EOD34887.1 hypothetical protein EMIHUDRAFT_111090 [Emiliania huxleyi CCMP1516]|eukprot:XP_005787316.1 hypothetical protein EMIHUDRAFT_111090 [Emiliania huxleyi CCMP1516]
MALRFQEQYGGTDETIGFWRFIVSAALTLVFGIVTAGGVSKLFSTLASSACGLAVASALGICTQSGFYYSLMLLDPAKAFLFISLSPVWAAIQGKLLLDDDLPQRTVVTMIVALISVLVAMVPDLLRLFEHGWEAADGSERVLLLIPFMTGFAMATLTSWARYCGTRWPETDLTTTGFFASLGSCALFYASLHRRDGPEIDLTGGLQLGFWGWLILSKAGTTAFDVSMFHAARHLKGAEVELIMLGEAAFSPLWVFLAFGETPTAWTLAALGLLLLALAGHEVAGMHAQQA